MEKRIPALWLAGAAALVGGCSQQAQVEKPRCLVDFSNIRVGTYKTRAVALAWGRSKVHNDEVGAQYAEYQKAKAAGDEAKVRQFKARGGQEQDRLHRQVFGDDPIPDVIARIKGDLPGIAKAAGVNIIVAEGCYKGPPGEMVDLTDLLVGKFDPTEATLKMIPELLKHPPIRGPIHD